MASVLPPAPTYTPNLPKATIEKGLLSLAQIEAVVYAGQAHSQTLPSGERRGFFIGDGTGVGKGREISGILLDNLRQGRTKAVWVSEKPDLMKDAQRDFKGVGGDEKHIFSQSKVKATAAIHGNGIAFTTYATLRSGAKGQDKGDAASKGASKSRIDQLVEWLGEDFDGVIAFDEAHNAGNAVVTKGKRGNTKPSEQALAVVDLQKRLPNARVVYVSATGATEVSNLSYATRLGLWGEGTPFASVSTFINQMAAGGLANMELVARDMKQMGMYLARSLSFEGVTYSRLEHQLSPVQRDIYDRLSEAWQVVLQNFDAALEATGALDPESGKANNPRAVSAARSAFWGGQQRFFNQVITSMQMPAVLEQMEKDVAAGKALVLQLVNTNEAAQERALAKKKEEGEESLEDLDLTPRDQLMQMVEKSFPVVQMETFTDMEGKKQSRVVEDSEGNPVLNKKAVAMRDKLLEDLKNIKVPDGPLEMVLNHFGPDMVAEVTGRSRRVVRVRDADGNLNPVIQSRGAAAARTDAQAFMDDKKQILIFSDAGGTGFSFHADRTQKNRRKRAHYLIQPGWRADKAVQGFGRTHRTNQESAPHYYLAATDIPAHKRFLSSIARRLDQLGALTKGQRDTANQGMFSEKDNLESIYATQAIQQLIEDGLAGRFAGFASMLQQMGLEGILDPNTGQVAEGKMPPVSKFLNRMLSLKLDTQAEVFEAFITRMEQKIETAVERGEFDAGLQTIKAISTEVVQDEVIHTDPRTKAETHFVELKMTLPNTFWAFPDSKRFQEPVWIVNKTSGKVYLRVYAGDETTASGAILPRYQLRGTGGTQSKKRGELYSSTGDLVNYEEVTEAKARELWEAENAARPATVTRPTYLITGAVLPIWDRLDTGANKIEVVRTQTADGKRLLGRQILPADAREVRKRFNVSSTVAKLPPLDVMKAILQGKVGELANGWRLQRAKVSDELRIEVKINGYVMPALVTELTKLGVISERINWAERLFIPVGPQGVPVLQRLFENRPLVDLADETASTKFSRPDKTPPTGGVSVSGQSIAAVRAALTGHPLVGKAIRALEKRGKLVIVNNPAIEGQGWFANGVMTLNAAFIRPGTELGVLLHEGGTHAEREAGARGILGDKAFASLTATLDQWANGKDETARDIAREATRRAANDRAQRKADGETDAATLDAIEAEERLAYAMEIAGRRWQAGQRNPSAVASWLNKVLARVKLWLAGTRIGKMLRAAGVDFAAMKPKDFVQIAAAALQRQAVEAEQATQAEQAQRREFVKGYAFSRSIATRDAYNKRIDGLFAGNTPRFKGVRVLDRADILDLLGFGDKPLNLVESSVGKPHDGQPRGTAPKHAMTAADWKKVPEWIENPAAVFKSQNKKQPGRLVLIAPETVNGRPVRIILTPNAGMAGMDVHVTVNAYDESGTGITPVDLWAKKGDMLYIDQKTSPALNARSGLRLPGEARQLRGLPNSVLTEADLGKYRQARPNDPYFSRTTTRQPMSIDRAIIASTLGRGTGHPDYAAAKAGDREAGLRIAQVLVDDGLAQKVRVALGGRKPVIVPVVSVEATGRNKIPRAAAEVLAQRLGLETAENITQTNTPKRTELDGLDRIFAAPEFEGEVIAGQDYLLLDDTLTQGGTFAALASHIEANGGHVVAAVALTGKQYSAKLALSPETLTALREKHGDLESDFRAATGYGFDALTESEARYLTNFKPATAVRDRILAERGRRRQGVDEGATDQTQGSVNETDQSAPPSAGTSRSGGLLSRPDSDTRFSRPASRPASDVLEEIQGELRSIDQVASGDGGTALGRLRQWIKDATPEKIKNQLRSRWLSVFATRHLTTMLGDYFPNAHLYTDYLAEMEADRNAMQAEGDAVAEDVRKWAAKNKADAQAMFDLAHRATIDGVDPAEDYQPLQFHMSGKWHEVNKQNVKDALAVLRDVMLGRGGDDKRARMEEAKGLRAMLKAEPRRRAKYPELVAAWNQLSPEAQKHYRAMRDLYRTRNDQTEKALVQKINDLKMEGGESRKQVLINMIRMQFEENRRQGVYFPLQRFGQYFVAAEKEGIATFRMYEKEAELDRAVNELRARGFTITARGLKSKSKPKDAPSGTFVAEVLEALEKAGVSENTRDDIYQMYLQALPEMSMRKHKIHRRSVPGWDPDAVRAFAYNQFHTAHQLARLRYGYKLADTIEVLQGIQDARRTNDSEDTARITAGDALLAELRKRHEWISNPQDSKLTNLVSSFGFTYYLGVTPAAALVNLTQVPMLSLPWLGSRFGAGKALATLTATMKDAISTGGNIARKLTDPDELRALQALEASGALDRSLAHNLAGIAEGGMAGYNPAWAKTMEIIGKPFHVAEVINRETTGVAAFRLARASGMEFDAAVKFAAETIHQTQFDYSNSNRARFMQSGTAKVLLMFRQYSLNLTWHIGRMVFEATKGADPQVRALARRNLAGVLGMSALFSGTLGLPLMSMTMNVLNALAASFGDDDDPWDAETEFRAFLIAHLGRAGADTVLNGVVDQITGASISSRVSYSDLWIRDADRELDGRGQYYYLLEQAAGPMGGVLKNVFVGKQMIDEGHVWRGVETMLPKALKDVLKAARYASEGVNNLRGDPIVADTNIRDILMQGIGFMPSHVRAQYDVSGAAKNYEQYVLDRRGALLDAFAMSVRLDDDAGRAAAMDKIRAFNVRWPELAITPKTIIASLRSRARYTAQAENGIMLNRKIAGRIREAVGVE